MPTQKYQATTSPLRSLIWQAYAGLWPYKFLAVTSIISQMAGVIAESIALLALGSLISLTLDDSSTEEAAAILDLPNQILSYVGYDLSTTAVFLLILVLMVAKGLLQSLAIFIGTVVWTGIDKKYINDLSESYSSADWNYLSKQRSGRMLNLMLAESTRAASTVNNLLVLTTAVLSAVVYLVFAALVSPVALGLFALSFGVLVLILIPIFRIVKNLAEELINVRSGMMQRVEELLNGVKVVKALGSEKRVQEQIRIDSSYRRRLLLRVGLLREMSSATDLGIVLAVFVLFVLHITGLEQALSAGVIGIILLRMSQRAQLAITVVGPIIEGLPSVDTTNKTIATLRSYKEHSGDKVPDDSLGSMNFEGVSYSYDGQVEVLKNINFEVRNGEFIGIVGGSGAGKTTLVDMMLGLLSPMSGKISVNDQDLSELQRVLWRRHLGYVPQDITLFHDTTYNNISAYRPNVSKADVMWAVNIAQASEFIENFEHGYDHIVGDRGIMLSGGQRQRLALARALATRPKFLLLDEATSSLDGHAEHHFQTALESLRTELTIIAIAHRIPTVMKADRVIVLSEGEIVETGPPLQLLKNPEGHFAKLYAVQSVHESEADPASKNDSPPTQNEED